MEYRQERIATLHTLESSPTRGDELESTLEQTAVVIPMVEREYGSPAAEGVLSALETLAPPLSSVIVAVRAEQNRIGPFCEWLESFDLPIRVLWCNSPAVETLMEEAGLSNGFGKGRDVWLAMGVAAMSAAYVVVHDADATSYEADHIRRLLSPLSMGYTFSKGYYARVEDGQLYGRLCRLFYEPLVQALAEDHDESIIEYLSSFRYALAGEFAMTADVARQLRPPRAWGLEVATLGDAFDIAGFDGTAQVDLGIHRHDHREVDGEDGLEGMSQEVATALLRVIESRGVDIEYETLQTRYLTATDRLIEQYRADALFNGLIYDSAAEREQAKQYAKALSPPGPDRRLPSWTNAPFEPEAVAAAAVVSRSREGSSEAPEASAQD